MRTVAYWFGSLMMKVILIPEEKGGDKTITFFNVNEIELSEEMEMPERIGFIPKPIVHKTLTVDVESMITVKLPRRRNVMKYIKKLFRGK